MVDHTVYPANHEPTLGLRQVFGRLGIDSALCLKAAKAGLKSVESFAMLGDDLASAKTTIKAITAGDPLSAMRRRSRWRYFRWRVCGRPVTLTNIRWHKEGPICSWVQIRSQG